MEQEVTKQEAIYVDGQAIATVKKITWFWEWKIQWYNNYGTEQTTMTATGQLSDLGVLFHSIPSFIPIHKVLKSYFPCDH